MYIQTHLVQFRTLLSVLPRSNTILRPAASYRPTSWQRICMTPESFI